MSFKVINLKQLYLQCVAYWLIAHKLGLALAFSQGFFISTSVNFRQLPATCVNFRQLPLTSSNLAQLPSTCKILLNPAATCGNFPTL